MKLRHFSIALLATGIVAVAAQSAAQPAEQKKPSRPASLSAIANRAIVMRVKHLGIPGSRAVVVRRPSARGTHDVILVDANTRPDDLAKAVGALIFSRRTQGQNVAREIRAHITPAASRNAKKSPDEQKAQRHLASLTRARTVTIPGIGSGPVVAISTAAIPTQSK